MGTLLKLSRFISPTRQYNLHMVLAPTVGKRHLIRFQPRLKIRVQCQTFADIGQRHTIAAGGDVPAMTGIGHLDDKLFRLFGKTDT